MPKLTREGQVTIPLEIRSVLRIKAGDDVLFEVEKNNVILKKRESSPKNLKKYIGFLAHLKGKSVGQVMSDLRGNAQRIAYFT